MATYKFRVLEGKHHTTDPSGNTYTFLKGDVLESEKELDKLFVNKFQRIGGPVQPDAVTDPGSRMTSSVATTVTSQSKENPVESGPTITASSIGDDVTDAFEQADAVGLKVFKNGSHYFVTEVEDVTKPLNTEPLKKQEVVKFINSL